MAFLERNANRGSVETIFDVENSLVFEADDGTFLKPYNGFAGSPSTTSTQIGTFSFWIKRSELGVRDQFIFTGSNSARYDGFKFNSSDQLCGYYSALGNGADFVSTQSFRDTSAWYHFVIAIDTTNGTAGDRFKIYVNGERITAWDTTPAIDQNTAITQFDTGSFHGWGTHHVYYDPAGTLSAYLADVNFINGTQELPTVFGKVHSSGIWIPIDVDATYGNRGYRLEFQDSSKLGYPTVGPTSSGNLFSNTPGISAADQSVDTPTNNFCTWQTDVKHIRSNSYNITFEDGATTTRSNSTDGWRVASSTMSMAAGKWYAEFKVRETADSAMFGAVPTHRINFIQSNGYYLGQDGDGSVAYNTNDGKLYYWTGAHLQNTQTAAAGDIIGMALDKENNKIYFSKNGTWMTGSNGQVNPENGTNSHEVQAYPYLFAFGIYKQSVRTETNLGGFSADVPASGATDANGYGNFEYAPPSGYYALCTKNLAEYG